MALDIPGAKPDTMEEVFSEKMQPINMDYYNIYHFDELIISGRRYQYRLSAGEDLMTVVCQLDGRHVLLVSVWTNNEHEKRLREIHDHIVMRERNGNGNGHHVENRGAPGGGPTSAAGDHIVA